MNAAGLLWLSLASGVLGLACLLAFLVTGRRNAALRVAAGILVIVCVVSGFVARP